jgi:hypothetical protein
VSKGYCLVVTDQKRAKITFGIEHVERQLARLNRYLDLIEPTQREIQTVNLMVERNTPVTFVEPPEEEPAMDETMPPSRNVPSGGVRTSAAATSASKSLPAPKARAATSAEKSATAKKGSSTPKPKATADAGKKKAASEKLRKPFRP